MGDYGKPTAESTSVDAEAGGNSYQGASVMGSGHNEGSPTDARSAQGMKYAKGKKRKGGKSKGKGMMKGRPY